MIKFRYKGKTEDARVDFDKKKQIADNILTEVVLYPTILCSVIGIATSTPFFPENIVKMDHEGHIVSRYTWVSHRICMAAW